MRQLLRAGRRFCGESCRVDEHADSVGMDIDFSVEARSQESGWSHWELARDGYVMKTDIRYLSNSLYPIERPEKPIDIYCG